MTEIIYRPSSIILTAKEKNVAFVPYRENFTYEILAGDSVQFEVKKAEEVMYYLMQENDNLTVEYIASNDTVKSDIPHTTITITNNNEKDFNFVPFNQSFGFTVKAGDTLIFESPIDIVVGDYVYHVADYYKNLAYGDVTISVEDVELATYDILASGCTVNIYENQEGAWVHINRGQTDGYVKVGTDYKFTVVSDGEVSIFRCNGQDLTITDSVEDADVLIATEEGFSIIAVGHGGDSSGSVTE